MNGQVTWRRTYGGFGSDKAASVRQTTDGGFIIAGSTGSFGAGGGDVYLVRVDGNGDPLWSQVYGGNGVEVGVACRELPDGFIVAATSSSGTSSGYDLWMVRTDLQGGMLWNRHYGTAEWDLCNAFAMASDGFVLGGMTYGLGHPLGAAYVVRTDLDGDTLWTRTLPFNGASECLGLSVTLDDGVLVCGRSPGASGQDDGFITRLDATGAHVWTTYLGGDSSDRFNSVLETSGGSVVACGTNGSNSSVDQIHLVALDAGGQLQWEQFIGNTADAGGAEIRPTQGGGFVLTGYNTLNLGARDMILTVTDGGGWFQYGNNFGNGSPADGLSVDTTSDGGYVVAGWVDGYGPGIRAMYVVRTDGNCQTTDLTVNPYSDPLPVNGPSVEPSTITLHPCPAHEGETVSIRTAGFEDQRFTVIDASGRTVQLGTLRNGAGEFSSAGFRPGLYIVNLEGAIHLERMRLVVVE
ncbi:MAG: PQQ-like beta-propeller repeat protein [Flavobacteriales bacterium]|nr:PQQ-like beta-propeller repeat protein [Flavobacteriales bacterium]